VSVESTNPQVTAHQIEETRKQINRLFDEVGHLSEMDLQPGDYFGEFLKRVLQGLAAPAGAVWARTAQGHLQLQHQINLRQIGLDQEGVRQSHDELLRQAFSQARALHLPPHSSSGPAQAGAAAPGNATDLDVLLVPIVVEQVVAGLVEVWISPNRNPHAIPGFLQFMSRLAHFASLYMRNRQLRQIIGQQQLWTQLENFARQVHGSLNPVEVSYVIANEGRRLIECDRVSVGVRYGKKVSIESISGADVVEKRSNLVQLMRKLCDRVIAWGEKLTYSGTKDDSLPPNVIEALDAYLAESNSKLLVAVPLKDEREADSKKPPRSILLMEAFDPPASTEQLMARLEVVGRHATSALYNAVEHRRIPLRFLWQPLAKVQEGLGGKTRAIIYSIAAAVVVLIAVLVFVPYPLKMDATGHLLPQDRQWIYSPVEGTVVGFAPGVEPSCRVSEKQPLVLMHDVQVAMKAVELERAISQAKGEIDGLRMQFAQNPNLQAADRAKITSDMEQKQTLITFKSRELAALRERTHAVPSQPGNFQLLAPLTGIVLNGGFRENLTNKTVKPSEPLLRIGNPEGPWEIEMKIPQKHIGQILQAFKNTGNDADLDVDLLLISRPTSVFKGKLARVRLAGEATPDKEDPNDSEPKVLAYVRIDGPGIDPQDAIPRDQLTAGTEVHAKVRCGTRAMGYSLFYGLWEFFYEKVVFWF
jgi:hypothetical protein